MIERRVMSGEFRLVLTAVLFAVCACAVSLAADADDVRALLKLAPSRSTGADCMDDLDRHIAERFAKAGEDHGEIVFRTAAFLPGRAELRLSDGAVLPLHSMAPSVAHPGNLPGGTWEGRLVDSAAGSAAQASFDGAAVLVDMKSRRRWAAALELGARVLIFTGDGSETGNDAALKMPKAPISVPRFYLMPDDARRLRKAVAGDDGTKVVLKQLEPNRWKSIRARDQWVILPGTDDPNVVVHLQAYKDAASFIPAAAPGAEGAANLALLLRLLDYYVANPPPITLVFSAVADHCNYLRGEQEYVGALFQPEKALEKETEDREDDLALATFYKEVFANRTPEWINTLRIAGADVAGRKLDLKEPIERELSFQRNKLLYTRMKIGRELRREGITEQKRAELDRRYEAVDAELSDVIEIMGVFRRYGRRVSFAELGGVEGEDGETRIDEAARKRLQGKLLAVMAGIEKDFSQKEEDAREGLERLKANRRPAELLAGKRHLIHMSLDISFGAEKMGFFFQGADLQDEIVEWGESVLPFAQLSVEKAGALEGGARYFADTIRNTAGVHWRNHLAGTFAMAATISQNAVVSSVTLTTADDPRRRRYTPFDTLENADPKRVEAMMGFAQRLIASLIVEDKFRGSTRKPKAANYRCQTVRYNLRRIDPYSVEVPTEGVPGAAVVFWFKHDASVPRIVGQVSTSELVLTDRQGAAVFRSVPMAPHVEAYGFDAQGNEIRRALDAGAGARRFDPRVTGWGNDWKWHHQIALMFDCVQTDLAGLYSATLRRPVQNMILLDANRETSPEHYGIAGISETRSTFVPKPSDAGVGCLFTEENVPIKVIASDFLLLNATEEHPEGKGYYPGDEGLRAISYASSKDMQTLTRARLARLESKGVTNDTARSLLSEAETLLESAIERRDEGHQRAALGRSVEALSLSERSYTLVRNTTSDLVKAVAAFLALVIPFCMFFMKLVTPWTDVRLQIAAFVIIFIATAGALAILHPAFSLSQTPMMVLLAFMMVGLAVFVMFIVYTRFDSGLKRLVEEAQGVKSGEQSRSMLAGAAFSVGVNNMRRRRIRTTLTSITIVLVTFTMLSVISVSRSLEPFQRRTEDMSPYDGVLIAFPGMAKIGESEATHVRSLLEPYGQVVERAWTQRLDSQGGYMPMTVRRLDGEGKPIQAWSLLGLAKAEDGFIAPMPLVAGRWFSHNAAKEVVLGSSAAGLLGVDLAAFKPVELRILDQPATLVGVVDDEKVAGLTDMARLPMLPLESFQEPGAATQKESKSDSSSFARLAKEALDGPVPDAKGIDPGRCVFVPIEFARTLPFTDTRSIAVKTESPQMAWAAGRHFVKSARMLAYVGLTEAVTQKEAAAVREGEYALGPPVGKTIGNASKVLIPICLAATIILNTMLGAVMERKREIAIYNSIGLNPTHVFMFFVAEALVFGTLGAVAGYLIGQALSQAIVTFGWMPDVNLNYSSTAVIVVIFAAIFTVVVSTLYPAYVATRASVPSGQRRWRLPAPEGDELHLDFPFSFQESQLPGVLAFIDAYMDLNSEASSGKFLAQDRHMGFVADDEGRRVPAMAYMVTPVPFDLGVNQRVEFYGYYRPDVRAHVLAIHVTRVKGDRSSWLVVNQPFMESLRARLLQWRSQTGAAHEEFCKQGEALFETAPEFQTVTA